jgi:hypothetical protein
VVAPGYPKILSEWVANRFDKSKVWKRAKSGPDHSRVRNEAGFLNQPTGFDSLARDVNTYAERLLSIGTAADTEIELLTALLDAARSDYNNLLATSESQAALAQATIAELEARLAVLGQQFTFTPPLNLFSTALSVGVNDTVWEKSTTTAADTITAITRPDGKQVFKAKAGGHIANSSGSTYARYRAKLPETFGMAPRGWFSMSAKVNLLTNADYYYSFLRTDNYVATMKGTTTKVGCAGGNEWRVGLMMYPGNVVQLQSTHQNNRTIVLWAGTLLPGEHTVAFAIDPEIDSSGSWDLAIDGKLYGGKGQTVPSTVPVSERVVTRAVTCIDGANRWVDKAVEVEVEEAVFSALK